MNKWHKKRNSAHNCNIWHLFAKNRSVNIDAKGIAVQFFFLSNPSDFWHQWMLVLYKYQQLCTRRI